MQYITARPTLPQTLVCLILIVILISILIRSSGLSVGGRNHICAKGGMGGGLIELGEPSEICSFFKKTNYILNFHFIVFLIPLVFSFLFFFHFNLC